ncbi:LysE family translocator [Hansschlegelia plantiphila]|uniref:Lysine transporter LysE n=1 Tax=Hansschlegelia plantiphila TaxID=374655 RepID=A0A9W6J1M5_9HYPH|nr:LysE family transporter [Hansschlegelia plantiphila]GLK68136.1 lysine transporter LysE [Hansschlegelia plantiphila]
MDVSLVATGIIIGIGVNAPVGPTNVMCIHRAIRNGPTSAMAAGAGAFTADVLFAGLAAFGVTAIATFVQGHLPVIKVVGGAALVAFGVKLLCAPTSLSKAPKNDTALSLLRAAVTSFALTVTNPAVLLGFFAIFGGLAGIGENPGDFGAAALLTLGVAIGSAAWWTGLSMGASRLREKLAERWLGRINTLSGGGLAVFGFAVLLSVALGF